jgi:endonuclease YncB( thermonuclease family)
MKNIKMARRSARLAGQDVPAQLCLAGTLVATVVSVYDGDTITVHTCPFPVRAPGLVCEVKIRVLGMDAAELRCPRNTPSTLRLLGKRARARVQHLVGGHTVTLVCQGREKYGRDLASVITSEGRDLGRILMDEHLAYPYQGKRKRIVLEQMDMAHKYYTMTGESDLAAKSTLERQLLTTQVM